MTIANRCGMTREQGQEKDETATPVSFASVVVQYTESYVGIYDRSYTRYRARLSISSLVEPPLRRQHSLHDSPVSSTTVAQSSLSGNNCSASQATAASK